MWVRTVPGVYFLSLILSVAVFFFKKSRLLGLFQHCIRRLIVLLLLQMSSLIHLQRRHAPYRRERPLLAKEGTITKEFS